MKKKRWNLLALAVMVFALALTITPAPVQGAAKLKVTSPKKVEEGKKITIKTNVPAAFKSSNNNVATVNKKGIVTGKKAGTVKITVTSKKAKSQKKTVKITVTAKETQTDPGTGTNPNPEPDPQPGNEGILTAEYKGKVPEGSQGSYSEYGMIVKVKQEDGSEKILNPEDYEFTPNEDVTIKNGKKYAGGIIKYGDITYRIETEIIDVDKVIPSVFSIYYPEEKPIPKGGFPVTSDYVARMFYTDRTEKIIDDHSLIKIYPREEESGGRYFIFLYEYTENYNGEVIYIPFAEYIFVKYAD